MLYSYRVRDKLGNITQGYLEAENHLMVVDYLLQNQFLILNLYEEKINNKLWVYTNILLASERVKNRDISIFMRQLATMIGAGIPIVETFKILAGQISNRHLRKAAAKIESSLQSGLSLNQAMELYKHIFSSIYINMIRAGETGGVLPAVLRQIAEHAERENLINDKIKSASVYPSIIAIVASLVIIFILTFILPSFVQVFSASETELPRFTSFILSIGLFIKNNLFLLIFAAIGMISVFIVWKKTYSGRLILDGLYLKMPLVGNLIKKAEAAKFARILGMLICSGIPILTSFQVLQGVAGNQVIASAIAEAREKIKEGQSIAAPLNKTGIFEPMVTQLIAIGEETGALYNMLERIAVFYETEVTYAVDSLMSIIEPLLIIIVALVIGMIIVAIYLPIFNLVTTVGI